MVLISKVGKSDESESRLPKVKPICLLDKVGKSFKKIITDKIYKWQGNNSKSSFAEKQFGFRKQRLTYDAVRLVKEITSEATANKGYALVVALEYN